MAVEAKSEFKVGGFGDSPEDYGFLRNDLPEFLFLLSPPPNLFQLICRIWNIVATKFSVGLLKKYEEEPLKSLLNFVTLCCGILTIETSDCFFRSFCTIGQNGTFSTTEQNQ